MGKPIEQAVGEVEFSAAIYQYYADNAVDLLKDEPIDLLDGEGSAFIRRSSVGLLLGIMPWNYPYYQVARFAGPNLVVGNTILLKHAPQCPESSAAMEQIFHEAGRPAGRLHQHLRDQRPDRRASSPTRACRACRSPAAAARAPRWRSSPAATSRRSCSSSAARTRSSCCKADDLDAVVEAAVGGRLENTGQACNAAKRFIVLDEHYDAFVEKFAAALTEVEPGDPKSSDTTIGPLSSTAAADRLEEQVKQRAGQRRARSSPAAGARATSSRPPC